MRMDWSPSLKSCPPLTLLQAISVLLWSLLLLLVLLFPSLNQPLPGPPRALLAFQIPAWVAKHYQWIKTKAKGEKTPTTHPTLFGFINRAHSSWKVPRRKRKTQSPQGAIFQSNAALYLTAYTCFSYAGKRAGRKPAGAALSEVLGSLRQPLVPSRLSTSAKHWLSHRLLLLQSKYFTH